MELEIMNPLLTEDTLTNAVLACDEIEAGRKKLVRLKYMSGENLIDSEVYLVEIGAFSLSVMTASKEDRHLVVVPNHRIVELCIPWAEEDAGVSVPATDNKVAT